MEAICFPQELCSTQRELAHLSSPCLCLHGTLTAHTLSYEDACWGPAPGSREASSAPDFLPTFTPCKAFRLDSLTVLSFHIYQEICRNASSTCLCSHLHFWLPGCLNLAPRLSHLEVNCSDSQLYIYVPSPLLFLSNEGWLGKESISLCQNKRSVRTVLRTYCVLLPFRPAGFPSLLDTTVPKATSLTLALGLISTGTPIPVCPGVLI